MPTIYPLQAKILDLETEIALLQELLEARNLLLKEFVSCVENPGAQTVWDDGYVDLFYTYGRACDVLGIVPQSCDEDIARTGALPPDVDHEGGYDEDDLDIYH